MGGHLMVLGGELDELAPIEHVSEICKQVPGPYQIVVYHNDRHAPGRLPTLQLGPHWFGKMAEWLSARMRGRRPFESSRYLYDGVSDTVETRPIP